MGIFDFVKDAGASIFGAEDAEKAAKAAEQEKTAAADAQAEYRAMLEQFDRETSAKLREAVAQHGIAVDSLEF